MSLEDELTEDVNFKVIDDDDLDFDDEDDITTNKNINLQKPKPNVTNDIKKRLAVRKSAPHVLNMSSPSIIKTPKPTTPNQTPPTTPKIAIVNKESFLTNVLGAFGIGKSSKAVERRNSLRKSATLMTIERKLTSESLKAEDLGM